MSWCGSAGKVPNMTENPQDIVDYAQTGFRTADLAKMRDRLDGSSDG